MSEFYNGKISYWMNQASDAEIQAQPDVGDDYDIAIIGGGFTGLWSAYYAIRRNPECSIALFEAEKVGYGASGRNGGWISCHFPGDRNLLAKKYGVERVRLMQNHIADTRQEIMGICADEGIDCDLSQGGRIQFSQASSHTRRLREEQVQDVIYGLAEEDVWLLSSAETREKIDINDLHQSLFYPNDVRVNPAKLIRGLHRVLLEAGVEFFENTPVFSFEDNTVHTSRGPVKAQVILCCTEAYSRNFIGPRRVMPVFSSIIATKPLEQPFWDRVGWSEYSLLGSAAHQFYYAQRTPDDRIVIGGRGSPYRWGGRTPGEGRVDAKTIEALRNKLLELFPAAKLPIAHAWRGAIGVTRDWCPNLSYDRNTGIGLVYGYAGHGLAATNLAARTLVSRIYDDQTDLKQLTWNEHQSPNWEPEPFRWIAIHGVYKVFALSDRVEKRTGQINDFFAASIARKLAGF